MNRFAQLLYGKIVYIYETNLAKEDLSLIFDPATFWVDVTGIDAEVGYNVSFKENIGMIFEAPDTGTETTLETEKAAKIEKIQAMIKKLITNGFVVEINGQKIIFDSDVYTQNTLMMYYIQMQDNSFTGTIKCRGYVLNDDKFRMYDNAGNDISIKSYIQDEKKSIIELDKTNMQKVISAMAEHIYTCKSYGWDLVEEVNNAATLEEVNLVVDNVTAGV